MLLTLYVLGPGLVEVLSSAPRLREIGWWWFPLMLVLEAGSFVCLWVVMWVAIRRASLWQIATSQLASNAFGRVVPGGGAAAGALQYRMLVDAGAPRGATATGLTAANLLTFGVLLGLPLLAVPAILEGRVDAGIRSLLVWAGMILLALIAGGVVLVVTDRPLRRVGGDRPAGAQPRCARAAPPLTDLPARLVEERDLIVRVVGARWKLALTGSLGKALLDFAVLAVALRAVGADAPLSLVLLSYFTAQLLAQIPITPGGLGLRRGGPDGIARAGRRRGRRRGSRDPRLSPVLVLAADTARRHQLVGRSAAGTPAAIRAPRCRRRRPEAPSSAQQRRVLERGELGVDVAGERHARNGRDADDGHARRARAGGAGRRVLDRDAVGRAPRRAPRPRRDRGPARACRARPRRRRWSPRTRP